MHHTLLHAQQNALWKLTDNQKSLFDGRVTTLYGLAQNWVRDVPPMQRSGSLKAHDLYLFVMTAADYTTYGFIPPGDPTDGWNGMLTTLQALLTASCDHQATPALQAAALKKIKALQLLYVLSKKDAR